MRMLLAGRDTELKVKLTQRRSTNKICSVSNSIKHTPNLSDQTK